MTQDPKLIEREEKPRGPLVGFMVIEDYTEDYSDWSGQIVFPDPRGANLYWQKTIKMIEHSALTDLEHKLEVVIDKLKKYGRHLDTCCCNAGHELYMDLCDCGLDDTLNTIKGAKP